MSINNSNNNSNNKDTKMLIVPAKYILGCVADDPDTHYPVVVTLRSSGKFGGTRYMKTPDEIRNHCKSRDVFQSSLVAIKNLKDGTYVDLAREGRFVVAANFMKGRRHMETLLQGQVGKMYRLLFHPEEEKEVTEEDEIYGE